MNRVAARSASTEILVAFAARFRIVARSRCGRSAERERETAGARRILGRVVQQRAAAATADGLFMTGGS